MKFKIGDRVVMKPGVQRIDSHGVHCLPTMEFVGSTTIKSIRDNGGWPLYQIPLTQYNYSEEMLELENPDPNHQPITLETLDKKLNSILELLGICEYENR